MPSTPGMWGLGWKDRFSTGISDQPRQQRTLSPTEEHHTWPGPSSPHPPSVAEGCLDWPRWGRIHPILQRLDAPGLGDTCEGATFSEAKGRDVGEEHFNGGLGEGTAFGCK